MKNRNQILLFAALKYVTLFLGFARNLINAKVLGPDTYGVFGTLMLILGYFAYSNLGVIYSMNREIVHMNLDADKRKKIQVYNTTLTFILVSSSLILSLLIILVIIFKTEFLFFLCLVAIISILDQIKNFFINSFRIENKIGTINLIEGLYNIIFFVLVILIYNHANISLILFSMILSELIVVTLGFLKFKKVHLFMDRKILYSLVTLGVPLLFYNLLFYILNTIDRIFIINYFSNTDLGYYTFAGIIVQATLVFLSSMLFLIYPKALKHMRESNDSSIIMIESTKINNLVETFGIILITIGSLLIFPFINYFAIEYLPSINLYLLLVVGVFFNQLSFVANSYLVTNKQIKTLLFIQFIVIVISVIMNYVLIMILNSLIGIAVATLMANILYHFLQKFYFNKYANIKVNIFNSKQKVNSFLRLLVFYLFMLFTIMYNTFFIYRLLFALIVVLMYSSDIIKYAKKLLKKESDSI